MATSPPPASGRRSGRKTDRRAGDVQYDFKMDIEGLNFNGDVRPTAGARYQVKWRRGEKLAGKTAALASDPADAHGRIVWNYGAAFTSTIQKKDPTRLHKKVVVLTLSEYRPTDGGKYDKKQWEASLNLAGCVGSAEKLGLDVPFATYSVAAGGGETGLVIHIGVSAAPHNGDVDNVQTDVPVATEMSGGAGDVPTEHSVDVELDDDLGRDDDIVGGDGRDAAAAGRSGRGSVTPPAATAAGGRRQQPMFTAVEITPPGSGADLTLPQASPSGVSMNEHIALAEELRTAQAELAAERARAKKYKQQAKEWERACKGHEDRASRLAVDAQQMDALKTEHAAAVKNLRKRTAKETQLFDEVALCVEAVLLRRCGGASARPTAAALIRAIDAWGALAPKNNPHGVGNTCLTNTLRVLRATANAGARREDRLWVAATVHLLVSYMRDVEPVSATKVETAATAFTSGDFAKQLCEQLDARPLGGGASSERTLQLSLTDPELTVLLPRAGEAGPSSAVATSFCVELYSLLADTLRAVFEDAFSELEAAVHPFMARAPGAEDAVLAIMEAHHAVLTAADADTSLTLHVLRRLFTCFGNMVFNYMLTDATRCTDEAVLAYKSACSKLESWMRGRKVYGRPPTANGGGSGGISPKGGTDDGCREALLVVRQACDLVLLRGGTVHDAALWSAIPAAHLRALLQNVKASAAPGDDIAPEVMKEVLAVSSDGGDADANIRPLAWPQLPGPAPYLACDVTDYASVTLPEALERLLPKPPQQAASEDAE